MMLCTHWLAYSFIHAVLLSCQTAAVNRLNLITSVVEYMNLCPDGKFHKHKPSAEPGLSKDCSHWASLSCCNPQILDSVSSTSLYQFTHNHCGNLSDKCQQVFQEDLCFYECSPNTGPWLVTVNRKISNERFFGAPLCQSECEYWWNSCKFDKTCVTNWNTHFNWSTGTNSCPESTSCMTIESIFGNATAFCELIWDHAWNVVPDNTTSGCMLFSGKAGISVVENNRIVAQKRAEAIIGLLSSSSEYVSIDETLIFFLLYLVVRLL
ncbi:Folate receptor alpha isoform 1 [Schistosoma japonicum]|uniref:Folate receptor alpha isoform 1 n=1 Tax=Schistosoma japonicum TaxID=6182 RepID=Q5DDB9_SCHJA|nr:SJCHGC02435 protein [Schistosoma japonicum]KAH8869922.1 Sperm-egg fusion protein Juno [Schistosoma japonicum]TNN21089.1 Folate receptor alpha isoform 1 [Schistosoma japonicum]